MNDNLSVFPRNKPFFVFFEVIPWLLLDKTQSDGKSEGSDRVENISRALKPLQHFNYMLNQFFHKALAFQMKGLGPRADHSCWCPDCRSCGQSLPVNHCLTYLTTFHSYNNYFIWPFVDHCHLPRILAQERPITGIVFPPTRKCLPPWRLTDSWLELCPPSQSSIAIVL